MLEVLLFFQLPSTTKCVPTVYVSILHAIMLKINSKDFPKLKRVRTASNKPIIDIVVDNREKTFMEKCRIKTECFFHGLRSYKCNF